MPLQRSQNSHLFFSQMCLHPGANHTPYAVMVAERSSVFLNVVDDAALEFPELVRIVHTSYEDEIEIRTLRVKMRGVCHTHRVRAALDIGSYSLMQAMEIIPGDCGLQRIDQNAIVA